jgi:glyoxylase-like metal-dependent hydrolase (beta-lactamase superfamily II)
MSEFIKSLSDEFENIYFIEGERRGGYPYSNSMLLGDYLIDTGISSGYIRKLRRKFEINTVILSHWHEDHIAGNRLLKNARFLCHSEDKHIVEDIDKIIPYYGLNPEDLPEFVELLEGFRINNIKINKTIEHDEILKINDLILKVIHTPGHTAGHCCFFEENSKIGFLADIDLTNFGPFYGGIDSSVIEFEESIEKLEKLNMEIAISGHKGIFQGEKLIKVSLNKYKSKIYEYDERILSYLSEKEPTNSDDLLRKNIIYKKYGPWEVFEITAEKIMIEKHFEKFLKNNIIEKKDNGYILS